MGKNFENISSIQSSEIPVTILYIYYYYKITKFYVCYVRFYINQCKVLNKAKKCIKNVKQKSQKFHVQLSHFFSNITHNGRVYRTVYTTCDIHEYLYIRTPLLGPQHSGHNLFLHINIFLSVRLLHVAADCLFPLISLINLYSSWHKVQKKLWR